MDLSIIEFNRIAALRQEINTDLMQMPVSLSTVSSEVCWVRTNMAGGETLFPVKFWGQVAKKRNPFEEVQHVPPEFVNFSAGLDEWAPDGEVIPRGTQLTDLYGLLENSLPQIVAQAQNEYEAHLAELLGFGDQTTKGPLGVGGGVTQYDGLKHFATNKFLNPNRPAVGRFSNLRRNVRLDRAGLIAGFQQLDSVKGPNGRPLRMPGQLLVVVSTEDQYDRAAAELFTKQQARPIGANAGAAIDNTPNVQGRAGLVKLTDLQDMDDGKGWYVMKIATAQHRPFVLNMKERPQVYIEGMNPNEHSRVTRNLIKYGWRGFWGMGYLWPQLSVKFVER